MTVFVIRRLMQSLLVLAATAVIVFVGVYAIGDPAEMLIAPDATPAERAQVEASLGLDKPLPVQFLAFLGNALKGDLGRSFVFNQPSISLILERLPATLELALVAILIALVIGIPLGLIAGLRPRSVVDETIMTGSILGFSLPNFWQGMMLVMIFSVWLGWLPSSGRGPTGQILGIETSFASWEGIRHLILPAVALGLVSSALIMRFTRASMLDVLGDDYVRTARAKGLGEQAVILRHALKNALIPILTVLGLTAAVLVSGAVVTETVFGLPGVGNLVVSAVLRRDYPVIQGALLVIAGLYVLINFAIDMLYLLVDPRVRY